MSPLFTLYNLPQCPGKNGLGKKDPIHGWWNATNWSRGETPFKVDEMPLETLEQPEANNECGFYVICAMLIYLGGKSSHVDELVCMLPISFISVNSTKWSTVLSYSCAFRYHLSWTTAQEIFVSQPLIVFDC